MASQRRHKSRRKRRGRYSGLYKVLSVIAIAAAILAASVLFFRVDEVIVTGNSRYTDQEIIEVSGVKRGDNLFSINNRKVSRELRGKLAYVQSVSMKKLLPDTISISVTETKAAATLFYDGRWWLLGCDGKLLEEADSAGDLAIVTGVTPLAPAVGTYLASEEAQNQRVENLKELLEALEENDLLTGLEKVEIEDDFSVTFRYEDRFTVHLSATLDNGMSYWLRRFAAALENPAVLERQDYLVEISDSKRLRFIPQ